MHEATLRLRHLMSFVGRNLHQVLASWLQSILMYEETIGKACALRMYTTLQCWKVGIFL